MTLRDHPDDADSSARPKRPQASKGAAPQLTVVPQSSAPKAAEGKLPENSEEELAALTELGAAQCTEAEAAGALGLSTESLSDRLSRRTKAHVAFEKGRSAGLKALRQAQLKLAETNASVAIFLGRVYLGQSDRREIEPRESNEIGEVAQNVRERLRALVAEANRNRGPYPGGD
jgi:hypothetical protein